MTLTPTRDRALVGAQVDTGVGSPVAPRPDIWAYGGSPRASDTGLGSPIAQRPDLLDSGSAFVPPLWL